MFPCYFLIGHYVFLETSRPINPGWKARLVSKYIGMRVACLKFWYHAFGRDIHMGELQLVVKTDLVRARSFHLSLKEENLGVSANVTKCRIFGEHQWLLSSLEKSLLISSLNDKSITSNLSLWAFPLVYRSLSPWEANIHIKWAQTSLYYGLFTFPKEIKLYM